MPVFLAVASTPLATAGQARTRPWLVSWAPEHQAFAVVTFSAVLAALVPRAFSSRTGTAAIADPLPLLVLVLCMWVIPLQMSQNRGHRFVGGCPIFWAECRARGYPTVQDLKRKMLKGQVGVAVCSLPAPTQVKFCSPLNSVDGPSQASRSAPMLPG